MSVPFPSLLYFSFIMDTSSFDNEKEIINKEETSEPSYTREDERRMVRVFDFRLLPFLSFMYLFSSLDRSSVGKVLISVWATKDAVNLSCMSITGNAVLDNFEQDLGMTGNQLNTAITIFYVRVRGPLLPLYDGRLIVFWIRSGSSLFRYPPISCSSGIAQKCGKLMKPESRFWVLGWW